MITAKAIAKGLEGAQRNSNGWSARCPAHDDRNPSLSINTASDGKVLVHCHAGCSQKDIIGKLKDMGLWEAAETKRQNLNQGIEAKYDYVDEDGELLFQVIRYKGKKFRQRHYNNSGEWIWNVKDIPKVPYNLPEIVSRNDEPVFIVEGEKDADALKAKGLLATCNAGGAGKWAPELSWHFSERTVLLVLDNDKAGHKHVVNVAQELAGIAGEIRVIDLTADDPDFPEKGDVSDWLTRGGNPDRLEKISVLYDEWSKSIDLDNRDVGEPSSDLPVAEPFVLGDLTKVPPREFVYDRHYIRGFISVIAGVGGSGKSTIVSSEALAIATGEPLLESPVWEQCRVWYVNLEDPKVEIERRIGASAKLLGISNEKLNDHMFVSSGRSSNFVLASDSVNGVEIYEPVKEALKQEIREKGIGVLILDPFVKFHRVSENANEKIDAVISELAEIAEETGVAIMLVAHLRKGAGTYGNKTVLAGADDVRGASSLLGAVRSARIVQTMSKRQAEVAKIDDRFCYSQVSNAKANMSPRSNDVVWRKLIEVDLENGTGTRPSDRVAAAESWTWPDDNRDGFTQQELRTIQNVVSEGSYRSSPQAKDWAGLAVAEALGLDIDDQCHQHRVKTGLEIMVRQGLLVITEKQDDKRQKRPFLAVGERVLEESE